jgi:hypothetical protein
MTIRSAVLAAGMLVWLGGPELARADTPLLHPSARALAAGDDEDPPPHGEDPRAVAKKKAVKEAAPEEEAPVYKKWWFWALTAAVVGGTVAFGVTTFKPAAHLPHACPPTSVACFGDGRAP